MTGVFGAGSSRDRSRDLARPDHDRGRPGDRLSRARPSRRRRTQRARGRGGQLGAPRQRRDGSDVLALGAVRPQRGVARRNRERDHVGVARSSFRGRARDRDRALRRGRRAHRRRRAGTPSTAWSRAAPRHRVRRGRGPRLGGVIATKSSSCSRGSPTTSARRPSRSGSRSLRAARILRMVSYGTAKAEALHVDAPRGARRGAPSAPCTWESVSSPRADRSGDRDAFGAPLRGPEAQRSWARDRARRRRRQRLGRASARRGSARRRRA